MTEEIEARVWEYIEKIDELGGAINAIEQHYYQTQIAESAYKYQMAIERRDKIVIGVNEFVTTSAQPHSILRVDEGVRARQVEKLRAVRATRDQQKVNDRVAALRATAERGGNVIPSMLAAVEAYATVGEISDALRAVWGVYDK
jgi:methylmalonyl-CoA mutase N-terminal domain/subunit